MKKQIIWYEDKFFWLGWVIQAVFVFIVAFKLCAPIFSITFSNATPGLTLAWWQLEVLILFMLLPLWILQFLSLAMHPYSKGKTLWLLLLGSYTTLGFCIGFGFWTANKLNTQRIVKWITIAGASILSFYACSMLIALYAVWIYDAIVQAVIGR